jgi:hypothetical protein
MVRVGKEVMLIDSSIFGSDRTNAGTSPFDKGVRLYISLEFIQKLEC